MMTINISKPHYSFYMESDNATLIQLGFSKNEATVYLALLRKGTASAGSLIKETGFHRNIVYDNLEKLTDKGLITYIIEDRVKRFQAKAPEALLQMLDREQNKLNERKAQAKALSERFKALETAQPQQEATIFRGVRGLKVLFKDTLATGEDYYVFGAPASSLAIMDDAFWKNYNLKREQAKITIRMIFNEELRDWSREIASEMTQVRFLPKQFDTITETMIYGDKVAIIVWTPKPIATLINDVYLADAYRQYFKILWEEAKS